jgi:TusA-related sulfurtransferase
MSQATRPCIDARGSHCPGPLMALIAALKDVAVGDEVEIIASDTNATVDFPLWTTKAGHTLTESREAGDGWHFVIRRER